MDHNVVVFRREHCAEISDLNPVAGRKYSAIHVGNAAADFAGQNDVAASTYENVIGADISCGQSRSCGQNVERRSTYNRRTFLDNSTLERAGLRDQVTDEGLAVDRIPVSCAIDDLDLFGVVLNRVLRRAKRLRRSNQVWIRIGHQRLNQATCARGTQLASELRPDCAVVVIDAVKLAVVACAVLDNRKYARTGRTASKRGILSQQNLLCRLPGCASRRNGRGRKVLDNRRRVVVLRFPLLGYGVVRDDLVRAGRYRNNIQQIIKGLRNTVA